MELHQVMVDEIREMEDLIDEQEAAIAAKD